MKILLVVSICSLAVALLVLVFGMIFNMDTLFVAGVFLALGCAGLVFTGWFAV
jgi:hypothetical protein